MAIRGEVYKPVLDPTEKQIRLRKVTFNGQGEYRTFQVPLILQQFFAQLLNHIGKRSDWFATCITCEHWLNGNKKQCDKFKTVPPPDVIANGCEHYKDDEGVPF